MLTQMIHEHLFSLPHEHTAQLYSLTRLSLSLSLEDVPRAAARQCREKQAKQRTRAASEDLGRSQKASMASSSRRKAPSVKDDLFAPPIVSAAAYHDDDPCTCASPTLPWRGPRSFITAPGTFLPCETIAAERMRSRAALFEKDYKKNKLG